MIWPKSNIWKTTITFSITRRTLSTFHSRPVKPLVQTLPTNTQQMRQTQRPSSKGSRIRSRRAAVTSWSTSCRQAANQKQQTQICSWPLPPSQTPTRRPHLHPQHPRPLPNSSAPTCRTPTSKKSCQPPNPSALRSSSPSWPAVWTARISPRQPVRPTRPRPPDSMPTTSTSRLPSSSPIWKASNPSPICTNPNNSVFRRRPPVPLAAPMVLHKRINFSFLLLQIWSYPIRDVNFNFLKNQKFSSILKIIWCPIQIWLYFNMIGFPGWVFRILLTGLFLEYIDIDIDTHYFLINNFKEFYHI